MLFERSDDLSPEIVKVPELRAVHAACFCSITTSHVTKPICSAAGVSETTSVAYNSKSATALSDSGSDSPRSNRRDAATAIIAALSVQ